MGRKKKEPEKKKDSLDFKLSELEKNFGLSRASEQKEAEYLKTDIFAFDYVLGEGLQVIEGGHKIELYGKESSGKTTFALKSVATMQKLGKTCVWVVSESFHKDWAEKMGVDTSKLLLAYPESLEDATETILKLVGRVDLIVIDSVATLIPEAELKKSMHEQTRGVQAKAYSQFCRKLYERIAKEDTIMVFINQLREKMGVLYGNPETTPCGRALRHLYDTRIQFRQGKPIKEGDEKIGIEITLKGEKNKLGISKRQAVIDFYYKDGKIDNLKSLFHAGLKYCAIERRGNTYLFEDKSIVGKDNFIKELEEKDWKKISKEIWKRLNKSEDKDEDKG